MRIESRRGFTLVELLVVVGILGLLIALLIPAIMKVRESANQISCKSNLRTIGLAFIQSTMERRTYPMGGCNYPLAPMAWAGWEQPATRANQDWGWAFQLLPDLNELALWKDPWKARTTPLPLFICPSRRSPQLFPVEVTAAIDYAGNGGHLSFVDPANGQVLTNLAPYPYPLTSQVMPHSGVIGLNHIYIPGLPVVDKPLRPADIHDGLSNTILEHFQKPSCAFR